MPVRDMGTPGPHPVAAVPPPSPSSSSCPPDTATDDHRTVIRDLTDARQRLDAGDCKGSIRASRDAVEVLRGMHAKHLEPEESPA